LYTSCMPDIKHPKCGAKMQRVYKRENSFFVSCG
jgi:ssDNA-binding Zn-finger/Zn-ribbon topoisomerase 1